MQRDQSEETQAVDLYSDGLLLGATEENGRSEREQRTDKRTAESARDERRIPSGRAAKLTPEQLSKCGGESQTSQDALIASKTTEI